MSGQTALRGSVGLTDDTVALVQRQYVYDAGSLSWVPETQASGGGGSNTEYTEDAASAANPVGVMGIMVRSDTPATQVTTDGDNIAQRGTNYGAAYVTLLDTGGSPVAVGGGTQYTEDAAAAANPIGNAAILVRTDTPATQVSTDGDNIAQRGTNYGAAYVTLLDTGGSPVSVGGGTQYTEDAAAAANPIGTALNLVRADALAGLTTTDGDNVAARGTDKGEQYVKHVDSIPVTDNAGSLTVDNPIISVVGSGTEAAAQRVTIATDSTGVLSIDDNGGSLTVDGTVAVTNADLTTLASAIKAEDVASAGADPGIVINVKRFDTPAVNAVVNTDGDYLPLITDNLGQLWTAGAYKEDQPSASGDRGVVQLAIQLATPADLAGTDADYAVLQMSAGRLWASAKIDTALPAGTALIGKVGLDQTTPGTTNAIALSTLNTTAIAANSGNKDGGTLRVVLATDQPALTNKLLVTPDSVALPANQSVNVSQINAVTPLMGTGNTGTGSPRVTVSTDNVAIPTWGHGATAAAVPANATYKGLKGITALPTAVTNGQLVGASGDVFGRAVVHLGTIRDLRGTQATTISSTTETTIVSSIAAVKNDLVMLILSNTSATAVRVDLRDTTAGTVIAPIYLPAGQPVGFGIPGSPIPQTLAAGNWTAQLSAAVTDVRVFALFEKNA